MTIQLYKLKISKYYQGTLPEIEAENFEHLLNN